MPNKLINETSPYLLQHANNPVEWQPFGIAAFDEAKRRNCPVIISIGYSACHWCHVMEHESFSVAEVAEIMNRLFVCIKVDREERPDVDQIYLKAVQLLHDQGGWPLNCFALPDGRPFWGGTYFRKDQWKEVLVQLSDLYQNNFDDILSQADRIEKGIRSMGIIDPPSEESVLNAKAIEEIFEQLSHKLDRSFGGTRGAPKFAMPGIWQFLLNYYHLSHSEDALIQVKLTLDRMSMGGIFDQLAGGFARYSTDAEWKVPHFEKMLYDNAQLAVLYSSAFKVTGKLYYHNILSKTLEFIQSHLTSPEGGFYSALDADSEGIEGKFYVWKKQEILDLLPEYGELLCRYWGIEKQGLWEKNLNILVRPLPDDQFAMLEHLSAEELRQLIAMASKVLINYRNQRIRPSLDDKIIASWNALMIKGFATAAIYTDNEEWKNIATNAANFLVENMISLDGTIYRTWKNGTSRINGFLDDYAFCADAFISLYQLTFEEKWLIKSKQIADLVIQRFSQQNSPLFWFMPVNNEDQNIFNLSRVLETSDGVEPSGNSVMAWVLLCLGNYFEDQSYINRSSEMCTFMLANTISYPAFYANWANVCAAHAHGLNLLVVTGPNAIEYSKQLNAQYNPFLLLAVSNNKSEIPVFINKFREGKTVIYKCTNQTCDSPVERLEDISI
ncbi:MAG: thioredoxin domain-containing protein [Chloroflexota bacterium]